MQGDHKDGAETPRPENETAATEPAAESGEEAIAFAPDSEDDPITALRNEVEETRSHMLRALAEAENVRRRAQRDVADARQYAVTAFARDLLNVSDNFKRALSLVAEDAELPDDIKGLVDGVRMTERELSTVFERHGVTITDPTGERFDPNRHQAMFEIENPDVPSGTVLQVVQSGAVIGERTLRPAMVGVSKGGPKPGEAKSAAPAEPEAAEGEGDPA